MTNFKLNDSMKGYIEQKCAPTPLFKSGESSVEPNA